MGLARAGLRRDTLGSLAIAGAVAVIAFALPIADHRVSGTKPATASPAYRVGADVTLALPDGASMDVTQTRPGNDQGTAVFVVDAMRVAVVVTPYHNGLDD